MILVDVRMPAVPLTELRGHAGTVNAFAWSPHSPVLISTVGDDFQANIWDVSQLSKNSHEPIMSYGAESEISQVAWATLTPDRIAIAVNNKLQVLRV